MFGKDDRCRDGVVDTPPIEIGGYKMIDVFSSMFYTLRINQKTY